MSIEHELGLDLRDPTRDRRRALGGVAFAGARAGRGGRRAPFWSSWAGRGRGSLRMRFSLR